MNKAIELDEFGRPRKRIVADGERVVVPLAMMDSAQRVLAQREPQSVREANDAMFADYYQRVTAHNAESNARTLTTAAANAAKVQAHADHHAHKDEQHELASLRTANDRAYAASVADLDYRTRRDIA